jgi:hypothetical protein
MAKYATGKYAKAISDRSGMEFPYKEMVREWNGAFVHVSEFEPKQPQLEPKPRKNFICKIFGIKQCACPEQDEHLELYEEVTSRKQDKINKKHKKGVE